MTNFTKRKTHIKSNHKPPITLAHYWNASSEKPYLSPVLDTLQPGMKRENLDIIKDGQRLKANQ